jgi:hypothetical protein
VSAASLLALTVLATLVVTSSGHAQEACAVGTVTSNGRITGLEAPNGTGRITVRLSELSSVLSPDRTDAMVTLDGVIAPANAAAEARAAIDVLGTKLVGRTAALLSEDDKTDRHNRRHGSLRLDDGSGLAEQLLASGAVLADVSLQPCARLFLQAEAIARKERRGIWRQSRLWTDLNRAAPGLPDFVLGHGRVASVGRAGRTTYINFGDDFRTDATVRLGDAVASALTTAGHPPDALTGQRIAVRGWATARSGLDMELASPEAIDTDAD